MDLCFDIDGVLCNEGPVFKRSLATPTLNAAHNINTLKIAGHRITLFTSRSWSEYELTEKWLKENDFIYDVLICGKPVYDILIDDKALRFTNWKDTIESVVNLNKKA